MTKVTTLNTGTSFGEVALTSKSCRRTAGIVANGDCYFVTLHKEDYRAILDKH
jgi:hypothetical protein